MCLCVCVFVCTGAWVRVCVCVCVFFACVWVCLCVLVLCTGEVGKQCRSPTRKLNLCRKTMVIHKPAEREAHQDKLDNASMPSVATSVASNLASRRCISGELVRPTPPSDDSPSTACQASAPGGVMLGKAAQALAPPRIVPSRRIPPPPPPSNRMQHSTAATNAAIEEMLKDIGLLKLKT